MLDQGQLQVQRKLLCPELYNGTQGVEHKYYYSKNIFNLLVFEIFFFISLSQSHTYSKHSSCASSRLVRR